MCQVKYFTITMSLGGEALRTDAVTLVPCSMWIESSTTGRLLASLDRPPYPYYTSAAIILSARQLSNPLFLGGQVDAAPPGDGLPSHTYSVHYLAISHRLEMQVILNNNNNNLTHDSLLTTIPKCSTLRTNRIFHIWRFLRKCSCNSLKTLCSDRPVWPQLVVRFGVTFRGEG